MQPRYAFSSLVTILRELTRDELNPLEVRFPYPRPTTTGEYARVFRAGLRFGASTAGLTLRSTDVDRPVTTGDEQLNRYLDQCAESLLQGLATADSVATNVLRTFWEELSGGRMDLATTAGHLGMSARTLQRRLHDR